MTTLTYQQFIDVLMQCDKMRKKVVDKQATLKCTVLKPFFTISEYSC